MSSNMLVIGGLILGVIVLVLCTVKFKIHPFFALIATTVTFAIVSGMNLEEMLSAFTSGMGGTMADIGLVRRRGNHGKNHPEDHRRKACGLGPCHYRLLRFHSCVL